MCDYLFPVGNIVSVLQTNMKIRKMIIIGTCITKDNNTYDYAGVPYPEGYDGKIACFMHRELVKEKRKEGEE